VDLLLMKSTDASSGGAGSTLDYISQIATDIQEKIPEPFDVIALRKERGIDISPSTVVLF